MLTSITPFGERSRGFSWRLTAASFGAAAILAGALAAGTVAAFGSLLPAGTWRTGAVLIILLVALSFDATPLRPHLPTSRRQVTRTRGSGATAGGCTARLRRSTRRRRGDNRDDRSGVRGGNRRAAHRLGVGRGPDRRVVRCHSRPGSAPGRRRRRRRRPDRDYQRVAAQERAARWLVIAAETVAIAVVVVVLA